MTRDYTNIKGKGWQIADGHVGISWNNGGLKQYNES